MKNILIIGATGFIGRSLTKHLTDKGFNVYATSRNIEKARKILNIRNIIQWDGKSSEQLLPFPVEIDIIINLAGENISEGKWTRERKEILLKSRIEPILALKNTLQKSLKKPELIIQASAIGYYGTDPQKTFTEDSPKGNGFVADLTSKWEETARELAPLTQRLVILRTGLVIDEDGGFLKKILPMVKLGFGGHLGNGKQWGSWISLADEIKAIDFLITNSGLSGVFNLTSPIPLKMKTLMQKLAFVYHKKSWFHVPSFVMKLAFGEMAVEILLKGQKVLPAKLTMAGFKFKHPEFQDIKF